MTTDRPFANSARPGEPALRLHGVAKSFGATAVLDQVDLAVPRGQIMTLLGPSGCGKTTLIRLVTGFEVPDRGEIVLAGRQVSAPGINVAPEGRRVGIVPQEGALFPHLDVAANVGFGLPRGGRTPVGRRRVADLLEMVGLVGLGRRRPDQLSGGQQQRVAVARALAPRPDVICLDEPFSALDAGLRASVREAVIAALRAESATVLLVTHDQDEALGVSDAIAVMLNGRVAQVGSPRGIYAQPGDPEVARFVGEANLVPGWADGHLLNSDLGALPLACPAAGNILAMLRPEQVVLAAASGPGPRCARVTGLDYHGHDALVRVRTAAGLELAARLGPGWLPQHGDLVTVDFAGAWWPLPQAAVPSVGGVTKT